MSVMVLGVRPYPPKSSKDNLIFRFCDRLQKKGVLERGPFRKIYAVDLRGLRDCRESPVVWQNKENPTVVLGVYSMQ